MGKASPLVRDVAGTRYCYGDQVKSEQEPRDGRDGWGMGRWGGGGVVGVVVGWDWGGGVLGGGGGLGFGGLGSWGLGGFGGVGGWWMGREGMDRSGTD